MIICIEGPCISAKEYYLYGDEYGLWQIYDGKLDYACRFEAGVENVDGTRDTVTTDEDYQRYYKKLCEIIKKYLT